jgi:thiol-disulfide isomerase/thioredoxin
MTILMITALIIIIFISTVSSYVEVVPLIELTDATYSKLVASEHIIWLIMFYAPWCHHCKKIRPLFEKLPALSLSHKIRYGVIDATVHTDSATK